MATSVTVTCWVKADTESKPYEVKVAAATMKGNVDGLKKALGQAGALREVLQRCYPKGNWEIFDHKNQRLATVPQGPAAGTSSAGVTVILGTEGEGLKQTMKISVKHMPHHKVMTNSEAHFTNEHGKRPARLLFCEFIDNSIEAFCRARGGANGASHAPNPKASSSSSSSSSSSPRPLIEVHLVYKTGPYDYARTSNMYLQQIIIVDNGPGMTFQQVAEWAQMANPADARKDNIENSDSLHEPCKANGVLGKFGMGSKKAGFIYGRNVRCVTCHTDLIGKSAKDSNHDVYELLLSEANFEAAGADWTAGEISIRPALDQKDENTTKLFMDNRAECEVERSSQYLHDLMERVEKQKKSFTMLIITDIKSSVQEALGFQDESIPNLIRDLRDMYFVYIDGIDAELHRPEESGLDPQPHERLNYRYGPIDIQVKASKLKSGGGYETVHHHSLRFRDRDYTEPSRSPDEPHEILAELEPHNLDRVDDEGRPVSTDVDRLRTLFAQAARDYFRFSLFHTHLGSMEGVVRARPERRSTPSRI